MEFFSGVYHPKDVPDEKVHWEHGEIETLNPSGIRGIHGNSIEIPWIFHGIPMESLRNVTLTKLRRNRDGIRTESVGVLLG